MTFMPTKRPGLGGLLGDVEGGWGAKLEAAAPLLLAMGQNMQAAPHQRDPNAMMKGVAMMHQQAQAKRELAAAEARDKAYQGALGRLGGGMAGAGGYNPQAQMPAGLAGVLQAMPAEQGLPILAQHMMQEEPAAPSSVQEYEFARQNGFQGSFTDFLGSKRASTNVNISQGGEGPPLPAPPENWQYVRDPSAPDRWMLAPIPGGPAARSMVTNEQARRAQDASQRRSAGIVLDDIGRLRGMIREQETINPVTGVGGALASRLPGTARADAQALIDTLSGNIGFDRLQQMRDESPTGGALGAISERELTLLSSVMGSLELSQSPEQLDRNLTRLEKVYNDIMRKASAYPNAAEYGFGEQGGGQSAAALGRISDDELKQLLGL